jgi:hypothetical protein
MGTGLRNVTKTRLYATHVDQPHPLVHLGPLRQVAVVESARDLDRPLQVRVKPGHIYLPLLGAAVLPGIPVRRVRA